MAGRTLICTWAKVTIAASIFWMGCGDDNTSTVEQGDELINEEINRPDQSIQSTDNGATTRPTGTTNTPANISGTTAMQTDDGTMGNGGPNTPMPANQNMTPQPMQTEQNNGMAEEDMALLDTLIPRVAEATCAALTQCCSTADIEQFFQPLTQNGHLEDIASVFPPNTPFDSATCPQMMTDAYTIAPFGPWILAIKAGLVEFNADEALTCLDRLQNVGCGDDFNAYMEAGECFGFRPPTTSRARRKAFPRKGITGEACMGLSDGVGGGFFGTCDPDVAWCAKVEGGRRGIVGAGNIGQCVAAAGEGQACGLAIIGEDGPSMDVCQSGLDCTGGGSSICTRPERVSLNIGDACYDNTDFVLVGDCQDSFCDIFGTAECEPLRDQGDTCTASYECQTGACLAGVCDVYSYCDGGE